MTILIDSLESFKVLKHYGIHAARSTDAGSDVTIAGKTDSGDVKVIDLQTATHRVERMVPLGSGGAEVLASNFLAHHHRGSSEHSRRMLEHLLLRVSDFFETSGVSDFRLTVRLHENSYTVVDATMSASKAIHLKERLDTHARDRKAAGYRPVRHD